MTFKLKKMTKKEILLALGLSGNYECWNYDYLLAQAAQLDGARQVREWGDGRCPHTDPLLTYYERRTCGECWKSLLKELEVKK